MPFRICKAIEIESGHILTKHPGKCRYPHGHSRRVEVVVAAERLDASDMVCDFKAVKTALLGFIDSWDHAICLNSDDPQFAFFQRTYGGRVIPFSGTDPTSEVMAKAIFDELKRRLDIGEARLERVRITETSSTWAEYSE